MKKITLLFCFLSIFLSGCATYSTATFEKNLNGWIGRDPDDLIMKHGVPKQILEMGTRKYLVYYWENFQYIYGTAPSYQTTYNNMTNTATTLAVGGSSGYKLHYYCKTTFTVENKKIIHWRYEGNDCTAEDKN